MKGNPICLELLTSGGSLILFFQSNFFYIEVKGSSTVIIAQTPLFPIPTLLPSAVRSWGTDLNLSVLLFTHLLSGRRIVPTAYVCGEDSVS